MCADLTGSLRQLQWVPPPPPPPFRREDYNQTVKNAIANQRDVDHGPATPVLVPKPIISRDCIVTAKLESSLVSLAGAWPPAPLLSGTAPYHPYHHHSPYHHPLYSSLLLGAAPNAAGVIQVRAQPAGALLLTNSLSRFQPMSLSTGSENQYDCCKTSPPLKVLASPPPISVYCGQKSPSTKLSLDSNMALEAVEKRLSVSPSVNPRTTPDNDISSTTTTTACTTPVTLVQHHNPGHHPLHHHHHHNHHGNPLSVGTNSTGLLSPNSTVGSRPNSVTPPPQSMTPPLPPSMSTTPAPPQPPVTPSSSSRTTPPSSITSTSPASVSPHTSHHIAAMGLLLSTSPHSPMSVPRRPDSTSSTSSSASSASSSLDHHHHHHHHHHRTPHHIFHPHHHHHQRFLPHLANMASALGGVLSHHPHHPNTQHNQRENLGLLGVHDHHLNHHHQNNVNRSLKFSIENILRPDFGRVTLKPPSSTSRDGSSNKDTDDEHSSSSGSSTASPRNHHTGSHRNHHHRNSSSHSSNNNAKSNSHHHHGHHKAVAPTNSNATSVSSAVSSSRPAASATGSSRQRPPPATPPAAAGTAPTAGGAAGALPDEEALATAGKTKDNANMVWPAWVYCTRYSDRPSSGPRSRRMKKKDKKPEEKRPRTAFTNEQLARLKKEFQENRYLTEKRRQDLARELQLNESQIKIWFQNKRAKIKKANGQRNGLALHLMAQGLYNHTTSSKDGEMDEDNDMMDDDHDEDQ